jgi:predicted PurR-regulated permease PerM
MSQLLSTKLPSQTPSIPISTLTSVLVAVVAIAALYLGREVLVPIALALLLSFVLAPLVQLLQAWYFPRIVAVLLVGLFAFSTIFALGAFMVSQVTQLATDLPGYQSTLREKIQSVRAATGGAGPLERASDVLKDLEHISLCLNREDSQRFVKERGCGIDSFWGASDAEALFRRLACPRD